MSRVLQVVNERVRIGECLCPDTPHADGDHAFLRPRLSPEGGMAASFVIAQMEAGDGVGDYMKTMGMVLLEDGLRSWDVLDDDGEPAPITRGALRSGMYDFDSTLKPIIDRCFELYEDSVMRPLEAVAEGAAKRRKKRARKSSPSGQTNGSTSASTPPSSVPPAL